jgi:aspartate kinase
MIIHKFGGTSVGSAERIANVAEIIIGRHQIQKTRPVHDGEPAPGTVVVVSAMSKVTDALITGGRAAAEGKDSVYRDIKARLLERHLSAAEALLGNSPERLEVYGLIEDRLHDLERLYRSIAVLGEFTVRGCDAVTSLGEQLSSNILAAVLRARGERAQAVLATELIVTDDHFGEAVPLPALTNQQLVQRILPLVERGVIPVITGYIAATRNGVTTTLGRGGSDYTAAIVGAGLQAEEVWIWSDVNGILTADPNLVPEACTLAELSYAEAAELAYYGADVLHPKTIRPVIESGIPLRILNSFEPEHPGTLIVSSPGPQRIIWPAIISTTGLSLIAIGTQDDRWNQQMAAHALQVLNEAGVEVPLFSQSFSEHSLNLVVREQNQVHCLNVLRSAFEAHGWNALGEGGNGYTGISLGVKEKVATVSVVGFPSHSEHRVVSHAFMALGRHGTRVIAVAQSGTEFSVSFCIPEEQVESTVRFLHAELGPQRVSGQEAGGGET